MRAASGPHEARWTRRGCRFSRPYRAAGRRVIRCRAVGCFGAAGRRSARDSIRCRRRGQCSCSGNLIVVQLRDAPSSCTVRVHSTVRLLYCSCSGWAHEGVTATGVCDQTGYGRGPSPGVGLTKVPSESRDLYTAKPFKDRNYYATPIGLHLDGQQAYEPCTANQSIHVICTLSGVGQSSMGRAGSARHCSLLRERGSQLIPFESTFTVLDVTDHARSDTLDLQQTSLAQTTAQGSCKLGAEPSLLMQLCAQLSIGVVGAGRIATGTSPQQRRSSRLAAERRHPCRWPVSTICYL